ncbi:hypothetical protein HQ865_22690 [Mucilaginibacter mali]|uniref:Holliday junction resolvase RuvC n=1 Tax=Mucilaginibacter mali TaxID=2740462 RepID=A0A7D4QNG5_9SPHI|nr:hypothetical protein [Mucilaginibacter mali]QKJ32450.1 hypothetical protein HQ865_22690 [Mucilaginibacter mali]
MTVLGISVGTKESGVCVLRDGKLLRREVHFYKRAWSDYKMQIIINTYRRYLKRFDIDAVVVKAPPARSLSAALRRLLDRTEQMARKRGCAFYVITKTELKGRTGTHSTAELIACACRLYPQLSEQRGKGSLHGNLYDKKMYEAVLAAHVVQQWPNKPAYT